MRVRKLFLSVLGCSIAAFAGCCWAAQAGTAQPGNKATGILLPPPVEASSPFAMDAPQAQHTNAIAFLGAGLMTAQDRQAVRLAAPAIAHQAALRGFDLQQGNWIYQQIACPIFPHHLLLLYSRDNGIGDRTEFSAVLSRAGQSPPRILPLLRRGYSPYQPAAVSAVTVAAFNALRAPAQHAPKVDWLTTGLCYAALSGAHVQLAAPQHPGLPNLTLVAHSLLEVDEQGGASVRFFDVENPQQITSWQLDFNRAGQLQAVRLAPVPGLKSKLLP